MNTYNRHLSWLFILTGVCIQRDWTLEGPCDEKVQPIQYHSQWEQIVFNVNNRRRDRTLHKSAPEWKIRRKCYSKSTGVTIVRVKTKVYYRPVTTSNDCNDDQVFSYALVDRL